MLTLAEGDGGFNFIKQTSDKDLLSNTSYSYCKVSDVVLAQTRNSRRLIQFFPTDRLK